MRSWNLWKITTPVEPLILQWNSRTFLAHRAESNRFTPFNKTLKNNWMIFMSSVRSKRTQKNIEILKSLIDSVRSNWIQNNWVKFGSTFQETSWVSLYKFLFRKIKSRQRNFSAQLAQLAQLQLFFRTFFGKFFV